jgi:hypothetical protein
MIALSESRLPDCLIETSYEGHSKTALAKPFGSLLFPASRSSVCSRGVAACSALMLPARITSELSWQLGD